MPSTLNLTPRVRRPQTRQSSRPVFQIHCLFQVPSLARINSLAENVASVTKSASKTISVTNLKKLPSAHHQLKRAMPISITNVAPGEFVASFFEGNVNASGETAEEALEMLSDVVTARLDILSSHSQNLLSEQMKQQLSALKLYIKKRA